MGGGQEAVFTQVRYLVSCQPGIRISIVLPEGGIYNDRFRSLGLTVHPFPLNRISPGNFTAFSALLASLGPDIVHSHGKGAGLYSRFPRRPGHWKRIHCHHGFHPPGMPAAAAYLTLERYLLRHTDAVVAVSPSEAAELCRRFPSAAGRIHTIPNIVDPAVLRRQSEAELTPAAAEFFRRNSGTRIVTMIARQDPVKNYPLAFGAMEMVLAARDDVSFLLVGVDTAGRTFRRLSERFPGRVFGEREYSPVASLLARTSIMLLTSKKEGGLPLVIQEGFSFGKPAVATDVEGIRDLVKHNINGLLCPDSPGAVASAVTALCTDPGLYDRLSREALGTAARQVPADFVNRYMTVYNLQAERADS